MSLNDQYHFLLKLRRKLKLKRLELCDLISITPGLLWSWEAGITSIRKPYLKLLFLIENFPCVYEKLKTLTADWKEGELYE